MTRRILLSALALLAAPSLALGQGAAPLQNEGFYTDRPAYDPGESITIHANWNNKDVRYALRRIGTGPTYPAPTGWTPLSESIAATGVQFGVPQVLPNYGSFVEFTQPSGSPPSLEGRQKFTLEGWIKPTLATGDTVVLAGQLISGPTTPACPVPVDGTAGIGLTATGQLFGAVKTPTGMVGVVDDQAFDTTAWHHVALTYNNHKIRLFIDGLSAVTPVAATGAAQSSGLVFLIGARGEARLAPIGINRLAGHYDGRLDDWSAWNRKLTVQQIGAVMDTGGLLPEASGPGDESERRQHSADLVIVPGITPKKFLDVDFEVVQPEVCNFVNERQSKDTALVAEWLVSRVVGVEWRTTLRFHVGNQNQPGANTWPTTNWMLRRSRISWNT